MNNRAKAKAITRSQTPFWMVFGFVAIAMMITLIAGATRAQDEHITISHGISKFGELKYGPDFTHLDYVNPDAPHGGEFSTWAFGTFDSLNRYITKGTAASSGAIFIESLMAGTADEPDSMYGLLAETIEYPDSREWAIFHLRPEAHFSDGSPVTAQDVVFTHELLMEKGIPAYRASVGPEIASIEALDDHTVKFTFANPDPNSNENLLLAAGSSVFSKAYWDNADHDFSESSLEPMLGSGPYLLDSMDVGRQLVYRYDPNYWGADLPINVGQNNFETIRFEYFADSTAAFEAFKSGVFLFRSENSSQKWAQDYDFPAINDGYIRKEEIYDGNIGAAQGFFFNLRRDKFDDPRVREAIGMAFNFEWSNRALFFGLYRRVDSFWENSELEAKGEIPADELAILSPFREYLRAEVFDEPVYSPPVSSEDQIDRRVIRAAGKLLDEAGWTIQDGVRKNAEGEQLTLEIMNRSPAFDRIINPFIENLELLGIAATNDRIDTSQYVERARNFDFDMMISTYGNSLTPGLGLRQRFGSESAMVPSRNLVGLQNEGIDQIVELAIAAQSREELNVVIRALDRALRAEHIWVPQWFKDVNTVAYWDVYEYPDPTLSPYALGASSWWWWSEEKAQRLRDAGML